MITVRLTGLLRLDTGVRALTMEAASVGEVYARLPEAVRAARPGAAVTAKDLTGCVALVNGAPAGKRTKLRGGDEVTLLSPVCGG